MPFFPQRFGGSASSSRSSTPTPTPYYYASRRSSSSAVDDGYWFGFPSPRKAHTRTASVDGHAFRMVPPHIPPVYPTNYAVPPSPQRPHSSRSSDSGSSNSSLHSGGRRSFNHSPHAEYYPGFAARVNIGRTQRAPQEFYPTFVPAYEANAPVFASTEEKFENAFPEAQADSGGGGVGGYQFTDVPREPDWVMSSSTKSWLDQFKPQRKKTSAKVWVRSNRHGGNFI